MNLKKFNKTKKLVLKIQNPGQNISVATNNYAAPKILLIANDDATPSFLTGSFSLT